eukprot:g48662.t1
MPVAQDLGCVIRENMPFQVFIECLDISGKDRNSQFSPPETHPKIVSNGSTDTRRYSDTAGECNREAELKQELWPGLDQLCPPKCNREDILNDKKKEAATQELGSEVSSWPLSRDEKRVPQHLTLCRVNSAENMVLSCFILRRSCLAFLPLGILYTHLKIFL